MKNIPIRLQAHYDAPVRNLALLVKVVENVAGVEGQVLGFCSKNARVVYDDGEHVVAYSPSQELRPQNIQQTSSMEVDNTEVAGWFGPALEQRLLAGSFSNATLTVYRVAMHDLGAGHEVVVAGRVGRVQWSAGTVAKRSLEFRSLSHLLKLAVNDQWSLTCRHDYGDANCGLPLQWHDAVVEHVTDGLAVFRAPVAGKGEGAFDFGVVEFTSGPNAGFTMEVETYAADGTVKLSFPPPHPVTVSTTLRIREDCDKLAETCISRGNIVNMGAEHLIPVQEQSIMVPGAYIKSENAL